MGYSLIRYLKNLPLAYYLKGGFTQMRGPTISLFLSPQQSAALVCRGHRAQGFELEIANLPDAPPVNGVDSGFAVASRSFSQKLLARSRARGVPRFIFIPDLATSDLYCNVHSVANLRELSIETLLESLNEDPRQVFGSWDESRKFRWEVFNSQLERVQGLSRGDFKRSLLPEFLPSIVSNSKYGPRRSKVPCWELSRYRWPASSGSARRFPSDERRHSSF
jgi:hypothetical protein